MGSPECREDTCAFAPAVCQAEFGVLKTQRGTRQAQSLFWGPQAALCVCLTDVTGAGDLNLNPTSIRCLKQGVTGSSDTGTVSAVMEPDARGKSFQEKLILPLFKF